MRQGNCYCQVMSNLRRARATASLNAWAPSGRQSSTLRNGVDVPVGRLIADSIKREVRCKPGAA